MPGLKMVSVCGEARVFSSMTYQSATAVGGVSTTWATPAEVLPLKLLSPAYVAVIVLGKPGVVEVSEQVPAATVPMQLSVPSETVTLPVGEPIPGGVTLTVKLTEYASPVRVAAERSDVMTV